MSAVAKGLGERAVGGPAGRQTAEEVPAPAGGCPADAPAGEEERKSPRSAQRGEGAVVGWTATDTRMHRNTADGGGGGRAVCEEKPRFWCAGRRGKRTGGKGREFALCRLGGVYSPLVARRGRGRPQRGGLPSLLPAAAGAIGPARSLRAVGVERDEGQEQKSRRVERENRLAYPDAATVETGGLGAKSRGVGIGGWFGLLGLRGSWSGERQEQKRRP